MFSLCLAGCSIIFLVFMLVRKVNAHMALLLSGLLLLCLSGVFGLSPVIDAKQSLHLGLFDIFQVVNTKMSSTLAGLGLTLMCIAGFSAYMDHVGASYALFKVFERPLKAVKSPYILLLVSYFVIQFLVLFIPSHAGLALLLMVTMYPILVRSGVSKLSALSIIAICQYIDHGPGSGNVILASKTAEIDPAVYFVHYQLPTTMPIIIAVGIAIYFCSKYFDKKEKFVFNSDDIEKELSEHDGKNKELKKPPRIYAILPIIPLVLILGFSSVLDSILVLLGFTTIEEVKAASSTAIKMNVPVAMMISTFIAIVFEIIRHKSFIDTLNSIMVFFKGMGHLFVITVSLIVCGQVFASGLLSIGFVDTLINFAKDAGFDVLAIIIAVSILLAVCAFLMGSGNAAFFSFAPLIPNIAKSFGVETITMIAPIQIMTGFGRCVSPIAPAILAISTMAKVNPLQVVKRTAIPMLVAAIVNVIMTYIYL
ncbi:anaerobic C4-dicarboxylate transporter, DcuC family [Campylobacter subantarcticus LMG 24377]|uniref:Anaerobic C4-dicarboxylate transporter, DcuC family n=2 Tax=Campylobacter subantarcticus TaxID=497724 RepID=A0A0A8H7X1_9BACT|nr:C4-dicarboxylate transporter DcuC [Campylobacter subantarcticus]EAJ1261699.1 anaerobic C4-dicarboxylate transporter, DcuC family [Campylobacter lari]AJC90191.1 anaerobic C4-dicarboxylate transporter, DcuC family [Campylobacter subantarcticus LMG 24374]AJC91860.1 anaerobic C4-dicarboxylate transporter, DcuC family [Campylobacter subantarcticus LMG 24377]EAL3939308.1 anaerobic C4-dicarboxylate transporter, DcuC family [Campylobacter lari]MPC00189.1 anaerobic C4-dicarboxylate transporter, DcuC